jgi:thiol-disulfide isomerase/thioredoxin
MKKFSLVIILLLFVTGVTLAQNQYQVLVERPNEKSLKGILSRESITSDTTFKWYADAQKIYTPYAAAVEALQKNKDSVQLLVFMGTWCEDSHFVIPRLYKLTDAAGFSDNNISLIGVDRNKKTLSHLCEALNVTNVPTIIVMKKGKEMGRVVEYGKYGMFDKELGEIITTAGTH